MEYLGMDGASVRADVCLLIRFPMTISTSIFFIFIAVPEILNTDRTVEKDQRDELAFWRNNDSRLFSIPCLFRNCVSVCEMWEL